MISLSLGRTRIDARCSRRLAAALSDDAPRSPASDAAFRLMGAVHDAIRAAHEVSAQTNAAFDSVIVEKPPASLSIEERRVFGHMMEWYSEAFGDRVGALDPRSGTTLRRTSATGGFELTGRVDLVLRALDGECDPLLEIHRISPGAPPPDAQWADAGAAVLLGVRALRVVGISGHGVSERVVAATDIDEFRAVLHDAVAHARAHPDRATAGWWCTSCAVALRCPAVPADPFERLVTRMAPIT